MIVQFLRNLFDLRTTGFIVPPDVQFVYPGAPFGPAEIAQRYIDQANGVTRACLACEGTGWVESDESWTLICPACRKASVA